jgi:hypothetical protein
MQLLSKVRSCVNVPQVGTFLNYSTHGRIYWYIESKSKHIIFYVVQHAYFIGKCMNNPLSAEYIHRDLVLIYWSRCALYSTPVMHAL